MSRPASRGCIWVASETKQRAGGPARQVRWAEATQDIVVRAVYEPDRSKAGLWQAEKLVFRGIQAKLARAANCTLSTGRFGPLHTAKIPPSCEQLQSEQARLTKSPLLHGGFWVDSERFDRESEMLIASSHFRYEIIIQYCAGPRFEAIGPVNARSQQPASLPRQPSHFHRLAVARAFPAACGRLRVACGSGNGAAPTAWGGEGGARERGGMRRVRRAGAGEVADCWR